MFSSLRTSPLAQRALGALDLARSFLMLEDDYDVDWEVDRDEPSVPVHPHRAPLRRRYAPRRAGAGAPRPAACLTPTFYGRPQARGNAGATREGSLSARRGSPAGRTETRPAGLCPPGCDCHGRVA
ncbi:MAG: hypothetical protein ACLQBB_13220 [Solirubrobacteraceae bacterium]